jgi:uncharacterized repeat protein (TIGR02543 family)
MPPCFHKAQGGNHESQQACCIHIDTFVLSNAIPTREGYAFKGWGKTATTTTVKTYDVALALRTTKLTRVGYIFAGWAATPDAATPTYLPGNIYTANEAAVLYAVWIKR